MTKARALAEMLANSGPVGLAPVAIARVCHEINRAYCLSIGDETQAPWPDAPDWQRESAVNGVIAHLDKPSMTPEQSHEMWWSEKRANGWVYGLVKNPDKKEHPCCVPYAALPKQQRVKDYLFKAVVTELAAL